jgi:CRP-like cAMP-binding protein
MVNRSVLRTNRALQRAARSTRDALGDILVPCTARRRTRLFEQGEPADRIFLIAKGRVRLERVSDGRVVALAHLGRGDLVGDLRLDASSPATETAIVIDEMAGVTARVSDVRELATRDPGVYDVLCTGLVQRCSMAEARLEGLLVRRVDARLASFLLHAKDRWGETAGDGTTLLATALRHHEIAAMIGTGREWVTTTLTQMKRRRILGANGRMIVIRDVDALERLAAGRMEL